MADGSRAPSRPLVLLGGAAAVLVVVVLLRGPVALLAATSVAAAVGLVLAVLPLLRHDGIDWDWLPDRGTEVPAEPGIATLRRLLAPGATDTAAPGQLQDLVRAVAEDRSPGHDLPDGPLATYLGAPPRRLDLREVDILVSALEALPRRSHP